MKTAETLFAETLFVDEQISEFRHERIKGLQQALIGLGIDDQTTRGTTLYDYAICGEVVAFLRSLSESSTSGVAARQQASEYLATAYSATTSIAGLATIATIGLPEDSCMFQESVSLRAANTDERALISGAVDVLSSVAGLDAVNGSVGIAAILGLVAPGEPIATWATGALPYVVHLHLMPRRELVARDLIHEATHNYLNDWLGSRGITLDSRAPRYWSPWKQSHRPMFGFVHSIFAFSVVTSFMRKVLDLNELTWLHGFWETERGRLIEVRESVEDAAKELPSELSSRMRTIYNSAVS